VAFDVGVKRLLGRFNLQLRKTLEEHAPVAERLLKDMLFSLAQTAPGEAAIDEVRRAYRLDGAVPADYEQPRYGKVDAVALQASREALTKSRGALDKVARGSAAEVSALLQNIDAFRDSVARLPAQGLQAVGEALAGVRRAIDPVSGYLPDATAMEVATAILFAEQALTQGRRPDAAHDRHGLEMAERVSAALAERAQPPGPPVWLRELSQAAQARSATAVFVAESLANLRRVEKLLDEYFRDPGQSAGLSDATLAMRQVGGAFSLLGHEDAARACEMVCRQVGELSGALRRDAQALFDRMASSIGALGFFTESLLHPAREAGLYELDEAAGEFRVRLGRPAAAVSPAPVPLPDSVLAPLVPEAAAPMPAVEPVSSVAAVAQVPAPLEIEAPAMSLVAAAAALPATAPTATAPTDDPLEQASVDAELLEIFLGEADEVLAAIAEHQQLSVASPADQDPLTTLRRGFHTLKGSGRMVGLNAFGEAAWALEQVLNLWVSEARAGEPALYRLIGQAHAQMTVWVEGLRAATGVRIDPQPLIDAARLLRDGAPVSEIAPALAVAPERAAAVEFEPQEILAVESQENLELEPQEVFEVESSEILKVESPEVFEVEPQGVVESEPAVMTEWDEVPERVLEWPPESALAPESDIAPEPEAQPEVQPEAQPAVAAAEPLADDLESGTPAPDMVQIGDRLISRPLYLIFLSEADELIQALASDTEQWRQDPLRAASEVAMRSVHSLAGSANVVNLEPVHQLAEALEAAYGAQRGGGDGVRADDFPVLVQAVDSIHAMLHRFAAGQWPDAEPVVLAQVQSLAQRWAMRNPPIPEHLLQPAPELIAELQAELEAEALAEAQAEVDAQARAQARAKAEADAQADVEEDAEAHAEADAAADADAEASSPAGLVEEAESPSFLTLTTEAPLAPGDDFLPVPVAGDAPIPEELVDELDPDLLAVFVEEASDDLPKIGENLRGWAADPADARLPQTLMRLLHTVKGSARMAGAMRLGQKLHDIETRVETLAALQEAPAQLIEELVAEIDLAVALFDAVRQPAAPVPVDAARASPATAAPVAAAPASQPLVRVRADLLDKLVNEAGEVSIARSRLDNELATLRTSLTDLTENVGRLRAQLREIEMQADSQIQTRTAQRKDAERDFDPLEFDRYTRLQELTRMMAESVSDVATVQGNALRSLEDAGQDLHRQGQVLRDLQQNLMRVRMVQFGSIADRLYRVVRQAAKETDKRVHLDIRGTTVEVDRGVLERMAGPIEHLLRNSIAHGIESVATRQAHGKPDTGEILVEVRQEGREIVLSFADDGGGLDLARIRQRAIAQGLINEQAVLSDRELSDLIFVPGFSTASSVTELAGRGIGMDVVRAEVASLGGRIVTDTQAGRGTRFSVHLPLTLAVAQVVLVAAGRARFAVPSSSVEQVMQLKPQALATAYADRSLAWQGQAVPLFFLGSLVESVDVTPLAQHYSPVVIVRSGHQRIALHADEITRNQEVVVKNVGPQVARVRGVTGATILGNGEIVLIIDPVALAQAAAGEVFDRAVPPPILAPVLPDTLPPVVMVVDDSVTVRKVTQRLLVREGYQVLLAKDGVDALRQLQDVTPDAMLLDIEMPRMDGFDLTRNLRADPRFASIPIIMITSRTADKHRNHAMGLGVNVFLGKPYQDSELLAHLAGFTGSPHRLAAGLSA
jgi:chemosensory pili system protein ChpA (sensor histidine kinase/response regulator)